jgi:hypothetical protein
MRGNEKQYNNGDNDGGGVFIRPPPIKFIRQAIARVEAGANTSTGALRVVGGDETESSGWAYNWDTLFLRNINTETWPSRLGESRIWDSKI